MTVAPPRIICIPTVVLNDPDCGAISMVAPIRYNPAPLAGMVMRPVLEDVLCIVSVSNRSES